MPVLATTPYLNVIPRTEAQAMTELEDRNRELRDAARSGGWPQTDRVIFHLQHALPHAEALVVELCHADGWLPIGDGMADELKDAAGVILGIRATIKRLERR